MKRLFKYLILFIVAAVFCNRALEIDSLSSDINVIESGIEASVYSTSLSATDTDICLPRQVSYSGPIRLQSRVRRIDNTLRLKVEFISAGRIINPRTRYSVRKSSVQAYSSFPEPSERLESLCILII